MKQRWLIISDTQMPFEAEHALKFCKYIRDHYKIPKENILHVGDEVDNLHGGMYPKDPDGLHTPGSEIKEAKEKIAEWVSVFPHMKVCISNHGMRWARKASAAEIPSQMIQAYQTVLGIPDTWQYQYRWLIKAKHPFQTIHGMEFSGKTPYRQAAEHCSISTAFGHLHSSPGIAKITTIDKSIWGMNTGCLIDVDSYAFKYGSTNKNRPDLNAGLVLDDGKTPHLIPYEL